MRPPLFETRITRLFGIRHPILCGGLMWLADARYVAAVVRAGAMGFLSARSSPDQPSFRRELRRCHELAEGRPFGVNLYISGRNSENAVLEGYIDTLLEEGIKFIETAGGSPEPFLPGLKSAQCKVIHKVSIVRHALRAQAAGVDAVSIVGMECGGHPGLALVGSMVQGALAPQRLHVPVALGGGIGTGRQMVATLALGAEAVVVGTRMVIASEIWAHEDYKRRVLAMTENDTRLVLSSFRNTYRAMDNETARRVAEMEDAGISDFAAYRELVTGHLQREAYVTGDWNKGVLSVGQAAVFANSVQKVEEIIDEFVDDAQGAARRLVEQQVA